MITLASHQNRQRGLALPISRGDDASWLRALPEFMGEVSVQGTDAKGVRVTTADVYTRPGTPAWRPPT